MTSTLLLIGDGNCGAWSRLLVDVLRTQGIDAKIAIYRAPPYPPNDLSVAISTHFPGYTKPPNIVPLGVIFIKVWTPGANPFDPNRGNGIAAQGNNTPLAYFLQHEIVEYAGKIYDPSYGLKILNNHPEWEKEAVCAFGAYFGAPLPNGSKLWYWKANPEETTETSRQEDGY